MDYESKKHNDPLDSLLDNDVHTALSVLDSNPSYTIANIVRLENDLDEDGHTTLPNKDGHTTLPDNDASTAESTKMGAIKVDGPGENASNEDDPPQDQVVTKLLRLPVPAVAKLRLPSLREIQRVISRLCHK